MIFREAKGNKELLKSMFNSVHATEKKGGRIVQHYNHLKSFLFGNLKFAQFLSLQARRQEAGGRGGAMGADQRFGRLELGTPLKDQNDQHC